MTDDAPCSMLHAPCSMPCATPIHLFLCDFYHAIAMNSDMSPCDHAIAMASQAGGARAVRDSVHIQFVRWSVSGLI